MKWKWLVPVLLVLFTVTIRLPAQQSEAEKKQFEEIKAEAEKGDAGAQCNLATLYLINKDSVTNIVEAIKWYRKAAEQGDKMAQAVLGGIYAKGRILPKDLVEAYRWLYLAVAQYSRTSSSSRELKLALHDVESQMTPEQIEEAKKLVRRQAPEAESKVNTDIAADNRDLFEAFKVKAESGDVEAQFAVGVMYRFGKGVGTNISEGVKWYRKAAEQGYQTAQFTLGDSYEYGVGVPRDHVEAYKWFCIASAGEDSGTVRNSKENINFLEQYMTSEEIAEAQQRVRQFKPRKESSNNPTATGTGFFITDDGYLISNNHVIKNATQVRLVTGAGLIEATVVKLDAANDLALLKAVGPPRSRTPLPVAASRGVKLGGTVATVGFPNIGMQGFSPKLAKGEIASLSGAADDARYFQISVPVQPGNSGGALVDEHGNVVGVVSAKLDAATALASSGALPENVNYAVKSSFLLSFLESVPAVSAKLKEPITADRKFEEVVKSAQDAAVLVLVY